jgi:hypothetical protein
MGTGEPTKSTGSAQNSTTGIKAEVAQVIIASIGVFLLLGYPVGFIILMAQIANTHDFDYKLARYAASLAPPSVVATKILFILLFSALAALIMAAVFYAVRTTTRWSARWYLRYLPPTTLLAGVGIVLPLEDFVRPIDKPFHALCGSNPLYILFSDSFLYGISLTIVVFGGVISYRICSQPDKTEYSLLPSGYLFSYGFRDNPRYGFGVGLIYALALIVGLSMSAVLEPNLPKADLSIMDSKGEIKETRTAYLLSVSNETWHAIDDQAKPPALLSFPADRIEVLEAKTETYPP